MTFHEPFTIDSLNSCENTRFPAVVLSYISIVTFPSARRFPVAVSLTFVPWSEIKKEEVILVKSITKTNKITLPLIFYHPLFSAIQSELYLRRENVELCLSICSRFLLGFLIRISLPLPLFSFYLVKLTYNL